MKRILLIVSLAFAVMCIHSQDNRLALVIGNGAYEHGGALRDPLHDPAAMGKVLEKLGFDFFTNLGNHRCNGLSVCCIKAE